MWLINCKSVQLEDFYEHNAPPYAILSHTWGPDEFLYEDIQNHRGREKAGFKKVQHCCEQALQDGLEYAWVDTCCIDKRSSSELSEAINSMFRWYSQSAVCYAYLCDLSDDATEDDQRFQESRWFTRGWTLQELLAPAKLTFYTLGWKPFKTREERKETIARVTGIMESALEGDIEKISGFSVAQKMYWASSRNTTRPEDLAYSLLGILNVSMPLLYGEGGEKAFIRLQEEIMRDSDDQSLLAWDSPTGGARTNEMHGVLASSPRDFRNSRDYVGFSRLNVSRPPEITNKGVRMTTQLISYPTGSNVTAFWAVLDCRNESSESDSIVGILLERTYPNSEQCARINAKIGDVDFSLLKKSPITETIYIRKKPMKYSYYDGSSVTFNVHGLEDKYFKQISCYPDAQEKAQEHLTISRQYRAGIPEVPWWKLNNFSWHSVIQCKISTDIEDLKTSDAIYIILGYDSKEKTTWNHLIYAPYKGFAPASAQQMWESITERPKSTITSVNLKNRDFNKDGVRQYQLRVGMQNLTNISSTKGTSVTLVYVSLMFVYDKGVLTGNRMTRSLSWGLEWTNSVSRRLTRSKTNYWDSR
jgi:hypothetical protein